MSSLGIKISALPAADAANATDQLETNQAGTSRRITVDQIRTFAGVPGTSISWLNTYPATAALYQEVATTSDTLPEFGVYTYLSSETGFANRGTAYKIGHAIWVDNPTIDTSADLYGHNAVVYGFAGAGNNLLTAYEGNVQNNGAAADALGADTGAYAFVAVPGGSAISTAAYWAKGQNLGWQYGFASNLVIGAADFFSDSSAPVCLSSTGTHTHGVDLVGATINGNAFQSTNFHVNALGAVTIGADVAAVRLLNLIQDGIAFQLRIGAETATSITSYDMGRSTADGLFYIYGNQTGANGLVVSGADGEFARVISTGLTIASGKVLKVGSNQVVGARDTGWTAMTGTPDESTAYATGSVTLPQLAGRVMALQAALTTHGLIGA